MCALNNSHGEIIYKKKVFGQRTTVSLRKNFSAKNLSVNQRSRQRFSLHTGTRAKGGGPLSA